MYNLTMVIYIQYKLHEIPSIGYIVMAEVRKTDGKTDGWMDKAEPISLHLRTGITKRMNLGGILFISMSIIKKYCLMKEDEIYIYTR